MAKLRLFRVARSLQIAIALVLALLLIGLPAMAQRRGGNRGRGGGYNGNTRGFGNQSGRGNRTNPNRGNRNNNPNNNQNNGNTTNNGAPGPGSTTPVAPPPVPNTNTIEPPVTTTPTQPAARVEGGEPTGPTIGAPTTFKVAVPEDGATVRGVVDIQVPAQNMPEGSYVSFALNDKNNFKYATVKDRTTGVFEWKWDTRDTLPGTNKPIFPDGNYTVWVFAHDPLGREMDNGETERTITVKNLVSESGAVKLAYKIPTGDERFYRSNYTLSPSVPAGTPKADIPKVTGFVKWDVSVDDYNPEDQVGSLSALFEDVAAEDQWVMHNARLIPGTWNATFFMDMFAKHRASFEMTNDGIVTTLGRPGAYDWAQTALAAQIYIPFPKDPVNVGDSWLGPVMLWTLGNHNHRTKIDQAKNTLVSFEWIDGIKAAKIRTDYSIELPPRSQKMAAQPTAQLGGMAASFGGAAAGMPSLATGNLKGERTTWFDYNTGRVIHVLDKRTITNLPSLFAQNGGGAGGSSGGGYPGGGMSAGIPGSASGGVTTADLTWLPGFALSNAAALAAGAGGYPGSAGGYPGSAGGYPGGYPGMMSYPGGYPGVTSYPGASGYPGSGYPGSGYPGSGYPGSGYPGSGYPGSGYPGSGYPGFGGAAMAYPGSGYPGSGYPGSGYPGSGYPGFGGADTSGGGYPGMGYPGFGGASAGYPGMGYPGSGYPGAGYPGAGYPGTFQPTTFGGAIPGSGYPGFGGAFGGGFGGATPPAVVGPPTFTETIETILQKPESTDTKEG